MLEHLGRARRRRRPGRRHRSRPGRGNPHPGPRRHRHDARRRGRRRTALPTSPGLRGPACVPTLTSRPQHASRGRRRSGSSTTCSASTRCPPRPSTGSTPPARSRTSTSPATPSRATRCSSKPSPPSSRPQPPPTRRCGRLDPTIAAAIIDACQRLRAGEHHDQFVVDPIQGGAGTSTNMNANEVIANLALEQLGHHRGEYDIVHPTRTCQPRAEHQRRLPDGDQDGPAWRRGRATRDAAHRCGRRSRTKPPNSRRPSSSDAPSSRTPYP